MKRSDVNRMKPYFTKRDRQRQSGLRQRGIVPSRSITYIKLWRRNKGICGICGSKCQWLTVTIDHIKPIESGGQDTWGNVQLAHPKCNASKGASKLPTDIYPNIFTRKGQEQDLFEPPIKTHGMRVLSKRTTLKKPEEK